MSLRFSRALTLSALAALCAAPVSAQKAAAKPVVHKLPLNPSTAIFGIYWTGLKPALTVNSGDIVEVETMSTSSVTSLERLGVKPADIPQAWRDVYAADTASPQTKRTRGGHILTGPIYVEGADSGDVLEVRMLSITLPRAYGVNSCSGFSRELCTVDGQRGGAKLIQMDRKKMTAEVAPGLTIPLHPFWGSVGVAPAASLGQLSSVPPGRHAGNLDNHEMIAGTSLYIPVFTKGALLEFGDGHAAQGDGEVDQTGIETDLAGRVQLVVHKDMKLEWPRIETPTHWIVMGTDTVLATATKIAIEQTAKFFAEKKGISIRDAYMATSMGAADLHITQLVDGTLGVHAMISKKLLAAPAKK